MTDKLVCPKCEEAVEKPKPGSEGTSFLCPKCAFEIAVNGKGGKTDGTIKKLLKVAGEESGKTILPMVKWPLYCGIGLLAGVFLIALYLFTKYPPFPNRLERVTVPSQASGGKSYEWVAFEGDVASYQNWTKSDFFWAWKNGGRKVILTGHVSECYLRNLDNTFAWQDPPYYEVVLVVASDVRIICKKWRKLGDDYLLNK